ncbi:beta-galactosidase [Paenibacillus sp. FA6]|uniref:beta-galactosidase n=1 Tax=Paenibacillus sp. FA6 TaxID=3413029 RepID=UPI003F6552A9
MNTVEQNSKVIVNSRGWTIEDQPEIILCASLFYFRIPKELWNERLQQVKDAGYNAIDVYFPWNFHEQERGEWDFSGEKDISHFLEAANEKGLWVIARPGPYICSEWDGGALPAYLLAIEGIQLRDNDPLFLSEVSRWFDRIMPILHKYELGRQGTIIAVQLDNELDFYNCSDPHGYISSLRDMALQYDVGVPLFACAGQGNLFRATGNAEGVMPTCNFYPNDMEIDLEDRVISYYNHLQERDYPLSVTETNRSHFLLRRLLGSGAKLLGPYLQVSGTNFGFNNAINNWGNPLAFLTSDYDFQGMIAPSGEERPEYYEGRLLSGILLALGRSLALAKPIPSFLKVKTNLQETAGMRYLLKLDGGGYLISLPNVGETAGTVYIETERLTFPTHTELSVSAGNCPILPFEIPLAKWGIEGELIYATAELFQARKTKDGTLLVFCSDDMTEASFGLPDGMDIQTEGAEVHWKGTDLTLISASELAKAHIRYPNGQVLQVIMIQREQAKRVKTILETGEIEFYAVKKLTPEKEELYGEMTWTVSPSFDGIEDIHEEIIVSENEPMYLESLGVNRGFAWYKAINSVTAEEGTFRGILLQNASDILSVYTNKSYEGTVIPGGSSTYVPFGAQIAKLESIVIRTEIWGHTNFDDILLPALQQSSMKGVKGIVAVSDYSDWTQNWVFRPCSRLIDGTSFPEESGQLNDCGVIDWGSWIYTGEVETGLYSKKLTPLADDKRRWIIHFKGNRVRTVIFVDKQFVGEVNLMDPYLDLTPYIVPGKTVEITLYLERKYREPAGLLYLIKGVQLTDWKISNAQEKKLWRSAGESLGISNKLKWPLMMTPGEVVWLQSEWKEETTCNDRMMQVIGKNAKVTAFYNGRIVGRIWLPCSGFRPEMTGGSQENIYFPGSWLEKDINRISLLVEAIQLGVDAVIESVKFDRGYSRGGNL